MAKPRRPKQISVTYVKASGIKCPLCPQTFVAPPGKNPAKILANHIKRKHDATQTEG